MPALVFGEGGAALIALLSPPVWLDARQVALARYTRTGSRPPP